MCEPHTGKYMSTCLWASRSASASHLLQPAPPASLPTFSDLDLYTIDTVLHSRRPPFTDLRSFCRTGHPLASPPLLADPRLLTHCTHPGSRLRHRHALDLDHRCFPDRRRDVFSTPGQCPRRLQQQLHGSFLWRDRNLSAEALLFLLLLLSHHLASFPSDSPASSRGRDQGRCCWW